MKWCFSSAIEITEKILRKATKTGIKGNLLKARAIILAGMADMMSSKDASTCPDGVAKLSMALSDTFYEEGGRYANPNSASDLALYHLQVARKSIGATNGFMKIEADILRKMGRIWHEHVGHEVIPRNLRAISYYRETLDILSAMEENASLVSDKIWTRALILEAEHDIATTESGRAAAYSGLDALFAEAVVAEIEDVATRVTALIAELKDEAHTLHTAYHA